jgi:transposase
LETPNLAKVGVMPAPKKYPDEVRERAVRMVFEIREESGQQQGAIARVADRLGANRETLRNWVRQAEIDGGKHPGTSTVDGQRIAELEREVRELRRANEILRWPRLSSRGSWTRDCPPDRRARRRPRLPLAELPEVLRVPVASRRFLVLAGWDTPTGR